MTLPSSIDVVVDPRLTEVGGAPVARVLPRIARRTVGPFVFFDHFGPQTISATSSFDVGPHPHIGLATVTYLFDGVAMHRDSVGSVQRIEPGAVNLMTAGRGIVHSERTPPDVRASGGTIHGLQLWVGLPQADEEGEPTFVHHPASTIPKWDEDGVGWSLLLGEAYGHASPARSPGRPILLDARLAPGAKIALAPFAPTLGLGTVERALYAVEGELTIDGFVVAPKHLVVIASGATPMVASGAPGARVAVLAGPALDGARYLDWNFVASSKERLAEARADWIARRFPLIVGDEEERIPHPSEERPQ